MVYKFSNPNGNACSRNLIKFGKYVDDIPVFRKNRIKTFRMRRMDWREEDRRFFDTPLNTCLPCFVLPFVLPLCFQIIWKPQGHHPENIVADQK